MAGDPNQRVTRRTPFSTNIGFRSNLQNPPAGTEKASARAPHISVFHSFFVQIAPRKKKGLENVTIFMFSPGLSCKEKSGGLLTMKIVLRLKFATSWMGSFGSCRQTHEVCMLLFRVFWHSGTICNTSFRAPAQTHQIVFLDFATFGFPS